MPNASGWRGLLLVVTAGRQLRQLLHGRSSHPPAQDCRKRDGSGSGAAALAPVASPLFVAGLAAAAHKGAAAQVGPQHLCILHLHVSRQGLRG